MTVSTESPGPYAPSSAIIGLLTRARTRGLMAPVTKDVLMRAGITDSLVPRTLQSLQTLDLIDETGQFTPIMSKLRAVPEAAYKEALAEWLQSTYAEVFQFVDPRHDDVVRVRDAFRLYTPHGQQDRMVSLFMALCAEAGIIDAATSEGKSAPRKPARPATASSIKRTKLPTGKPQHSPPPPPPLHSGLPPALAGMLESIPRGGAGWTKSDRDKFVLTFGAVLDFAVPIVTAESLRSTAEPVQDEEDES